MSKKESFFWMLGVGFAIGMFLGLAVFGLYIKNLTNQCMSHLQEYSLRFQMYCRNYDINTLPILDTQNLTTFIESYYNGTNALGEVG